MRLKDSYVLTKEIVVVYKIDHDTLEQTIYDDPKCTIIDSIGERNIVFYGAPGKGNTPLAQTLAAEQSRSNQLPNYVSTTTADSLRELLKNNLLVDGMGIVLDEWKPRNMACGAQDGGDDHLKNMLGPTDSKTIQSRFHDFSLGEEMPRFITVQNLGKLMPGNFHEFTWGQLCMLRRLAMMKGPC